MPDENQLNPGEFTQNPETPAANTSRWPTFGRRWHPDDFKHSDRLEIRGHDEKFVEIPGAGFAEDWAGL